MVDVTNGVMDVLENAVNELEAQENLLLLASEEADKAATHQDFSKKEDVRRACVYAGRASIMLTLLYTVMEQTQTLRIDLQTIIDNSYAAARAAESALTTGK